MNKTLRGLLGTAVALSLMGQGCALTQQSQVETEAQGDADAQIDASVDAMIKAEDEANMEEREGDTDGEKLESSSELDTYVQTQYDLQ